MSKVLEMPALDANVFQSIDRHFARLMERLSGGDHPGLGLAAALVSRSCGEGNICLDLRDRETISGLAETDAPMMPETAAWLAALRASPVVGSPGEFKPLILDAHGRLYLHRYWEYETRLVAALRAHAQSRVSGVNVERLRDGLRRFFPAHEAGTNWQQVAAFAAMQRRLCVITGGPGTGKTHTVVALLALLLEQTGDAPLRLALAAPTGKAAARLQESVQRLKAGLPCEERIKARLPGAAATLHRLLGASPGSASFRHHAKNRLPLDVLVVDEASMVDLALMTKLFEALPASARVILLGDKDQLASVEAGAVLGDICSGRGSVFSTGFASAYHEATGEEIRAGQEPGAPGLADCIVQLERNHRFAPGSGILELSRAVNAGEATRALEVLGGPAGVCSMALPAAGGLKEALRRPVLEGFGAALRMQEPEQVLAALGRFRILAALRRGPHGVENLNRLAEEILREAGLIASGGRWFAGQPVMVTENDHGQRLFNGDIGIAWPEAATGQLRVFFPGDGGAVRAMAPARLPRHETAFALTVHKSQGSEFERVLLVLPERESRVLTRELIYTGLTRASASVEVWMHEPVFRAALARRVQRSSGLREGLWPDQ